MDDVLFALTVFFVVAAVLLLVAANLGRPVIPFYLLAGVIAGTVIDETQLLDLAQWGIAFLVLIFGVRVDLSAFRSSGRLSLAIGGLQAVIVGAIIYAGGFVAGLDPLNALYLAIAAALSSSLVSTSYLDVGFGARPTFERLAESIHFAEDVLGVVIVVALSAFVYATMPAWEQLAAGAGLLGLAIVVRYLAFHRLTARVRGDDEVMMLVAVSFAIGFIALGALADLSIVVGAFAAGIAIADDYPHSLDMVDTVDDLEDFFSPIFFVTVGALLAIPTLETVAYTLALLTAIFALNPLVVAFVLGRGGFDGRTAIRTGLTLTQVSTFSLFVAIEALAAGEIARPVFDAIVLATVVSMIVSTVTTRRAGSIVEWLRDRGLVGVIGDSRTDRSRVTDGLTDHVIVVDYDHGGRAVLEACSDADRPMLVIEDDPALRSEIDETGANYVFGDVGTEAVWDRANLSDAALVVSLTPERDRGASVLELETDVPRLVRVDSTAQAKAFLERGADGVVYPGAIAGKHVGDDLAALLADEISIDEFRERGRASTDDP